jgi:hypothetical protein
MGDAMSEQKNDFTVPAMILAVLLGLAALVWASHARADTFNERFPAETPKSEAPLPAGEWSIKLLLIIDNKIARSVTYNEETYPTGDACKNAILADIKLQASMQEAATEAVKTFGPNAAVAIACAMHLD